MKFYQKRGFALVVLVLAILGSCVYGISKKPADLPQVSYGNWLRDDADLLTDETEASLRQYDQSWDSDYRGPLARAAPGRRRLSGHHRRGDAGHAERLDL